MEPAGIELLDIVLDGFTDGSYAPVLRAMRGDLKRSHGLFDAALEDLAAAERQAYGSDDQDFVLYHVHGFRAQVWLDMGILLMANAEMLEEGQISARLAEATRDRGDPQSAAVHELSTAYRASSLEVAMGEHRKAANRMAAILSSDLLQPIPQRKSGVEVRHGQFLVAAARDELHGSTASRGDLDEDPSTTLRRARSALEASLGGNLAAEEELEARLSLVDAGWLSEDLDLESRELEFLEELLVSRPEVFPAEEQGRLAAFRARHLLERGDASDPELLRALADVEVAFARAESEWLAKDREPEGLGFLHYPEQRLVVETWARLLIEIHDSENGPREALAAVARAQAIGTLTLRLNPGGLSAAELFAAHLAALPEGAGILVFLPSLDSSLVFAADREHVRVARLPADSILEKHAERLATLVRRYPGQPRAALVAERAAALSEVLLPAEITERVKGWTRILLVGTELFGSPGLEPLPLGPGTLGEQLATSYLPSIPLAELLRRRAPGAWSGARVAFLAATGVGKEPLELEEDETARLRELVGPPGLGGLFEWGERASGKALRRGSPADLLAILGHGRYDPLQRRPASIELADGPLGCDELERIELPPVVCLLSCGAARGPRVVGDAGTAHLGGAALVGGAEAVLVADTDVEVEATLALFEDFLGCLRAGYAPDEALRQARLAVAERDPGWNDPFFDSGLRLFGWGRHPAPAGGR